jgi:hypothetical protein
MAQSERLDVPSDRLFVDGYFPQVEWSLGLIRTDVGARGGQAASDHQSAPAFRACSVDAKVWVRQSAS